MVRGRGKGWGREIERGKWEKFGKESGEEEN